MKTSRSSRSRARERHDQGMSRVGVFKFERAHVVDGLKSCCAGRSRWTVCRGYESRARRRVGQLATYWKYRSREAIEYCVHLDSEQDG